MDQCVCVNAYLLVNRCDW